MPLNRFLVGGVAIDPPRTNVNLASGDGAAIASSDDGTTVTITHTGRGPGVWSFPVTLSALANSQSYKFTPGVAGRIKSVQFMVTTAVTTGSKAATLTAKIATVACTGGVISLTSANCTPIGAEVDGTAVTAGNTFGATDQISIDVSAVTTFVEGAGVVYVNFA